ncbi:MAG: hypothetical protein K6A89_08625 [Treponema sp.]|nr:hypothetical protein [Treponema sp.]
MSDKMAKISNKDFFIKYGILVGVITVLFFLMFYTVKISNKSWNKYLRSNIEITLEENEPNTWTVDNPIKINNSFAMNAAGFDVRNRKNGETRKAVIIRVQSIYGPLAAVFTVSKSGEVYFSGYSSVHSRVLNQLNSDVLNKKLEYWKDKIPYILELSPKGEF